MARVSAAQVAGWIAASRRTFRCATSPRATMAPSAAPTSSSIRDATSTFAPVALVLTSTAQYRSGPHRPLQGQQERLRDLLLKPKCTTAVVRKITRDLNEEVRDRVRALADTEAFQQSHRSARRSRCDLQHMKRILGLDRLRLRGLNGAMRRGAADRDRAEPEAARQATRTRPHRCSRWRVPTYA